MSAVIDKDQCTGCGNCVSHCPKRILTLSGQGEENKRNVSYIRMTEPEGCVDCGICELMCTAGAIRVPENRLVSGYQLIDKKEIPPHAGCYLGSLTKVLADVIEKLGICEDAIIFKKKASDVNLLVETHDYGDEQYYEDGMKYKAEHPDKMVVLICSSSKAHSTALNVERYASLREEKVTIINTLNWFEAEDGYRGLKTGGCHFIEEVAEMGNASFVARGGVRDPEQIRMLEAYLEKALKNQLEGKNFSIVEMLFPCFYRVAGRPQTLMPYEEISRVNRWFDTCVSADYENKIYLDR